MLALEQRGDRKPSSPMRCGWFLNHFCRWRVPRFIKRGPLRTTLFVVLLLAFTSTSQAQINWTTGGDASGNWSGSSFNGQSYTTSDNLVISGTAAKTVTVTSAVTSPNSLTISSAGAVTIAGTSPVSGGSFIKTGAATASFNTGMNFSGGFSPGRASLQPKLQ